MKEAMAERQRLDEDARRERNWKRWGPYLSERQWGTVREDYSADGACWEYFPHDHARSRAYRWGEDGLLGICDRECRMCFAVALWNGRDAILKERLFGLTNHEGNHGEDVKEAYFYVDSTPTHSYVKGIYKYPQAPFPYDALVEENRRRTSQQPEFEIFDTGVFDDGRYFDVITEYAKAGPDDILIRLTIANRGPDPATLDVLPTLWMRNTWAWGRTGEGYWPRGSISRGANDTLQAVHPALPAMQLAADGDPNGARPTLLFTDNETNMERLFGSANPTPWVKDGFHRWLVDGEAAAVNPAELGTKVAAYYRLVLPPGAVVTLRLRLTAAGEPAAATPFGPDFDRTFADRIREADAFYAAISPPDLTDEERRVVRQGYAGLLWTKQFYHYIIAHWLDGDPAQPPPAEARKRGRNAEWRHLYNRDVVSMPDKWEYPWYAAWDLAFHMIPFAHVDPTFAKEQLVLMLREWYMHPNGQVPAYEFAFGDVNPPVQAWAAWRVYKMTGARGARDRLFLSRVFQKFLLNFTWWVNRKDVEGNNLFSGGFLGLDNIGVFDRSKPLPTGGTLEQADGTAWMAFYCTTMLSMALELARDNPATEDMASKFFEHFVEIVDAMNTLGGTGLWDEEDGFYYDQLHVDGRIVPLKVRSIVGLIPLVAVENLDAEMAERLPGFAKRTRWFLENHPELARHLTRIELPGKRDRLLLAIPPRDRLVRVLRYMLDENEFLSPYGIRSMSRIHLERPFVFRTDGQEERVAYLPGDSDSRLFGGNSNWRGPIWFPLNYLLIEALERYHHFYGDDLTVEYPTGSGRHVTLAEVGRDLARRLARIFLPDAHGHRPVNGGDRRFAEDPDWRDLISFYEFFHGDDGRGLGASHQTGWTALVVRCIQDLARRGTRG